MLYEGVPAETKLSACPVSSALCNPGIGPIQCSSDRTLQHEILGEFGAVVLVCELTSYFFL